MSSRVVTIVNIKEPIVNAYNIDFIIPPRIRCRIVSLKQPKANGERGRSKFVRLHVEACKESDRFYASEELYVCMCVCVERERERELEITEK